MSTDTDLANQALALIGQDSVPSLLTSLNNKTVVAINAHLANVKEQALRARDWECARRRAALVTTTINESLGEWAYSYRTPPDCLAVRRLVCFPYTNNRHVFSWEIDSGNKRVLYCNMAEAAIVYTGNVLDVNRWDRLLFNATAALLASRLAGSFGKDIRLAEKFLSDAYREFDEAVGVDEGEGNREIEVSTTFIDVRNGGYGTSD